MKKLAVIFLGMAGLRLSRIELHSANRVTAVGGGSLRWFPTVCLRGRERRRRPVQTTLGIDQEISRNHNILPSGQTFGDRNVAAVCRAQS